MNDNDNGMRPPAQSEDLFTSSEWPVGKTRIIEYESYLGQGTGETAQVKVRLLGFERRHETCAGPRNPVAVILRLRVENVGSTVAEFPQLGGYRLSEDGRRVENSGCMTGNDVPTLKPGEYAIGLERAQVPDPNHRLEGTPRESGGSLVVETAYPFVDSMIALDGPSA